MKKKKRRKKNPTSLFFLPSSLFHKNILITCGPMWVPIDDVRVISNISSGELGHRIAEEFAGRGAQVTVLEGPVTFESEKKPYRVIKYKYYDEFVHNFTKELKKGYTCVVHAAAVSDFKVQNQRAGKIFSNRIQELRLTPTKKVINQIKAWSRRVFLVGFKLEPSLNQKNVVAFCRPLFEHAQCDLVVANSLAGGKYKSFILDSHGRVLGKFQKRSQLAQNLVQLILNY